MAVGRYPWPLGGIPTPSGVSGEIFGKVRARATLMGASEVTSQIWRSGGERLCDFDGDF